MLGPLLFICYISDVVTALSSDSDVNMFADDIALYRTIKTSADYIHLQSDINSICISCTQRNCFNSILPSAN